MASKTTEKSTEVTTIVEPEDFQAYINKEVQGIGNFVPTSWEDLVSHNDGEIIEFEGSPWILLKDKSKLVDVPFMIADVRHYEGNYGSAVAIMLLTENPLPGFEGDAPRYVINDGSTGLYDQVTQMVARSHKKSGILCPRGLRASNYTYQQKDFDGNPMGPEIPATTYYVA